MTLIWYIQYLLNTVFILMTNIPLLKYLKSVFTTHKYQLEFYSELVLQIEVYLLLCIYITCLHYNTKSSINIEYRLT